MYVNLALKSLVNSSEERQIWSECGWQEKLFIENHHKLLFHIRYHSFITSILHESSHLAPHVLHVESAKSYHDLSRGNATCREMPQIFA